MIVRWFLVCMVLSLALCYDFPLGIEYRGEWMTHEKQNSNPFRSSDYPQNSSYVPDGYGISVFEIESNSTTSIVSSDYSVSEFSGLLSLRDRKYISTKTATLSLRGLVQSTTGVFVAVGVPIRMPSPTYNKTFLNESIVEFGLNYTQFEHMFVNYSSQLQKLGYDVNDSSFCPCLVYGNTTTLEGSSPYINLTIDSYRCSVLQTYTILTKFNTTAFDEETTLFLYAILGSGFLLLLITARLHFELQGIANISLVSLYFPLVLDFSLMIGFLYLSIDRPVRISNFAVIAAFLHGFCACLCVMLIGDRRHREEPTARSPATLCLLFIMIVAGFIFAIVLPLSTSILFVTILLHSGPFITVMRRVGRGSNRSGTTQYWLFSSSMRLVILAYFAFRDDNVLETEPYPQLFIFTAVAMLVEIFILAIQEWRPRLCIPDQFFKQKWQEGTVETLSVDPNETCVFCFRKFDVESGALVTLDCNHTFHAACLEVWINDGNQTCPVCRKPIES